MNAAILEVIIGLIFIYSLLSVMVTQINTVITSLLNTRAKHLKAGLEAMLTDPVVAAKFLAHPLIRLIEPDIRPDADLTAQAAAAANITDANRVTWIPDTLFSQALLDIISANVNQDLYGPLQAAIETQLNGSEKAKMRELLRRLGSSGIGLAEFRGAINTLGDPADRAALTAAFQSIDALRNDIAATSEGSRILPLLDGISRIQNPMLQNALQTLLASARTLEEAVAKLEFWFNARMGQLSEEYKRKIQTLSLLIGLLLALLLNADSLYLARTLWDDPALREAISLTAQQQAQSGQLEQQIQESRQALEQAQATPVPTTAPTPLPAATEAGALLPTGETPGDTGSVTVNVFGADAATLSAQAAPLPTQAVQDTLFTLLNLRLPIGWEYTPVTTGCPSTVIPDPCGDSRNLWNLLPGNNPGWFGLLLLKLIGLAATMIAVAQGAPFWFDLLNRVARGRGSDEG